MSECEALCSRLAIVSDGTIKTIGHLDELNRKYAKGFHIIIKTKQNSNTGSSTEILKTRMLSAFGPSLSEKYSNFGVIHFSLNTNANDIKLWQILTALESIKIECNLEDYYVSDSTLYQTFHTIIEQDHYESLI